MNSRPLASKIALVTGGTKGIGQAIALLLADNGAKIIITGRHSNAFTENLTDHDNIEFYQSDVSSESEMEGLFEHIKTQYGQLDILVNNAAILLHKPYLDTSLMEWQQLMNVNVLGSVICSHYAFRMMKENKNPSSIINISSLSGIPNVEKFPGTTAYVTSKYALSGLTDALAVEGKPYHIRVNAIAPGAVETDMLKQGWPSLKTSTKPIDIAKIALFLADGNQSGCMTGNIIPVFCNE